MSVKRPDPIDCHVGNRIRTARLLASLSQTALAKGIGVTFQQVQKYEKGVNRVGAGRITRIGEIVGQPTSYFFENTPSTGHSALMPSAAPNPLEAFAATPDGIAIARAFITIDNKRVRKAIVELVEAHAQSVPARLQQAA